MELEQFRRSPLAHGLNPNFNGRRFKILYAVYAINGAIFIRRPRAIEISAHRTVQSILAVICKCYR